jgi:hypothetical protein
VTALTRRGVLLAQGGYYVTTGVVPFVSRRSFEAATGPKREWWLVQTVGGLVTVIGSAVLVGAGRQRYSPELLGIAAGSAAVLATIDVVYAAKRRISPRYLVDADAQLALLAGLVVTQSPNAESIDRPMTVSRSDATSLRPSSTT